MIQRSHSFEHKVLAGYNYLAGPSKLTGPEGSAARKLPPGLLEPLKNGINALEAPKKLQNLAKMGRGVPSQPQEG